MHAVYVVFELHSLARLVRCLCAMGSRQFVFSFLVALTALGCADDSGMDATSDAAQVADADHVDAASDGAADPDSGFDGSFDSAQPDAGVGDASQDAAADASAGSTRHSSYVPAGQMPKSAARLIVMGDSISTGTGASAQALRYYNLLSDNADATWPDAMALDLAQYFGEKPEMVHVAKGGSKTRDLVGSQLDNLKTKLGDSVSGHSVVVITSGGNDVLEALRDLEDPSGAKLDAAIKNLSALADFFADAARFPDGVSLYVAAVYDPTDGKGKADPCYGGIYLANLPGWIDDWRTAYRKLAQEKGFAMVDALGHFRGHGFNYDDTANRYHQTNDATFWLDDCVHPNDRGHHEFRRLFYEAIDPAYLIAE